MLGVQDQVSTRHLPVDKDDQEDHGKREGSVDRMPTRFKSNETIASRDSKDAGIDALIDLGLFVPEPLVFVEEASIHQLGGSRTLYYGLGEDDTIYKVTLDFGQLGKWDIYVNRSYLTSIVSIVKMKRVLGQNFLGNRLVRRQSALNLSLIPKDGESMREGDRAGRPPSEHPGGVSKRTLFQKQQSRRNYFGPQQSTRPLVMRYDSYEDASIGTAPGHAARGSIDEQSRKHIFTGLTKFLFVPAVGTQAWVRKVKQDRLKLVESIFAGIVKDERTRNSDKVKEYLKISNLTFDTRFGKSYMEGWIKATVSPRMSNDEKLQWKGKVSCCCCVCACAPDPGRCTSKLQPTYRRNRKMWAVVKSSFIALYTTPPGEIDPREAFHVAQFSRFFEVHKGYSTTGSDRSITIVESSHIIRMKFPTKWEKKLWSQAILNAFDASHPGSEAAAPVEWSGMHAFRSFAPRRYDARLIDQEICRAQWHIDGESMFEAVYNAIDGAESQIFIQGWWVCPDLPLIRPASLRDRDLSLSGLLEKKAGQGVQVVILMYNEVSLALPLNATFQERQLKQLENQENIFVLRHPEHKIKVNSTWFWSHHEKLVIVDQCHAFCGGLDLCWGRFDTHEHPLYEPHEDQEERLWPGIDYSNVRVKDFDNVKNIDVNPYDKYTPRMPWHDVHCEYVGAIGRDIARHFIQQWNNARFSMEMEKFVPALVPMDILPPAYLKAPEDLYIDAIGAIPPPSNGETNPNQEKLSTMDEEEISSQRTLSDDDFDEEGNLKMNVDTCDDNDDDDGDNNNIVSPHPESENASPQLVSLTSSMHAVADDSELDARRFGFPVDAQVVRSLGSWSGASPGQNEKSIENAMMALIDSAKHFIYIENQFFISGLETDPTISNRVLESIMRKIVQCHETKQALKIYVVIPLLPGFEGNVEDNPSIRRVLFFQFRSISRGANSLFFNLLAQGINPDDYIVFLSLRTWQAYKQEKIATELIYVHSKVLIVDDEACMIGSGNLNERSLCGNRDTEVSVCIREPKHAGRDSMDESGSYASDLTDDHAKEGRPSFVRSFRLALFKEHWGNSAELHEAILDPVAGWKKLKLVASMNTQIFEMHFDCLPRNNVIDQADLRRYSTQKYCIIDYDEQSIEELMKIKGHIVVFPTNFLANYDLKPGLIKDSAGTILGDELYI